MYVFIIWSRVISSSLLPTKTVLKLGLSKFLTKIYSHANHEIRINEKNILPYTKGLNSNLSLKRPKWYVVSKAGYGTRTYC
jgi:hypothetical protein